jgi:hypothetical protein
MGRGLLNPLEAELSVCADTPELKTLSGGDRRRPTDSEESRILLPSFCVVSFHVLLSEGSRFEPTVVLNVLSPVSTSFTCSLVQFHQRLLKCSVVCISLRE